MKHKRLPKLRDRLLTKCKTMAHSIGREKAVGAPLSVYHSHMDKWLSVVVSHLPKTKIVMMSADDVEPHKGSPLVFDGMQVIDDWFVVFDRPIVLSNGNSVESLITSTKDAFQCIGPDNTKEWREELEYYTGTNGCYTEVMCVSGDPFLLNWCSWLWNDSRSKMVSNMDDPEPVIEAKNLAITCASLINHHQVIVRPTDRGLRGETSDGNSDAPPPYYVCEISGVLSESIANGMGTRHGHEYDVRAHRRRLDGGEVVRVKSHRRGVNAEGGYVPKVYKV